MQSAPIEWALDLALIGVKDAIRNHGEPDGDTLTECVRVLFRTHTPEGRAALAATLGAGGLLLYRHFVKPEMHNRPTP